MANKEKISWKIFAVIYNKYRAINNKLAIKESLTKEEIKFAEDLGSTLANKVNQSC